MSGVPPAGAPDTPTSVEVEPSKIYIAKSFRLSVINWFHVSLIYVPHVLAVSLVALAAHLYFKFQKLGVDVTATVQHSTLATVGHLRSNFLLYSVVLVLVFLWWKYHTTSVYIVDFSCYQPPKEWQVSHDDIKTVLSKMGCYTEASLDFMSRILEKGATGQNTHWPPNAQLLLKGETKELDTSLAAARAEAETVIFGCMDDLLAKTTLKPSQIDFLIINCSLFSPTPSLSAIVCNKYKLRPDVRSYNIAGQGCSAGIISIDLAQSLLAAHPRTNAVVISTENITQNLYLGNERAFLLQNTLFRVGGAAILLSNKINNGFRAKYKLLQTIRVQNSSDDGYNCVYQAQDSEGNIGVRLSKDITSIAGRTLKDNLTMLGPHVLPIREQAKVLAVAALRAACRFAKNYATKNNWKWAAKVPAVRPYVPDFKTGVDHFCIHAGGRAVIDGIEKNLSLQPAMTEPSRATLYNMGNTSSSSVWYELKFIEERQQPAIRRGHRVLQLAFGSGFKVNSALLLRMRD